ncbi:antibiotic biosynthesis monooxygenase [Nocardia speluncae]|uniref:Antibiotic biosynthesis monooxygenase n=1 Tax=Nocardia speluncae TaxID=419477 RepID=A0A846XKE8_9NOCA|nr:antibiotic biosynthesis monooxygenase family protein [Nocardia speluncae]NKY36698.1 antibiotic biosynthesis monooxygenase [Nocardia speluncae]
MVIVAGHLLVAPEAREAYLAGCVGVVRQARSAPGCLDFAISADLTDPGRINILERWESQESVEQFRGSGTGAEQSAAIVGATVAEYDIADIRSLT